MQNKVEVIQQADVTLIKVNGNPVKFKNKKALEMFEFIYKNNGQKVTISQLISQLWPNDPIDEKAKWHCRLTWYSLKDTLKKYGIENILKKENRLYWLELENEE